MRLSWFSRLLGAVCLLYTNATRAILLRFARFADMGDLLKPIGRTNLPITLDRARVAICGAQERILHFSMCLRSDRRASAASVAVLVLLPLWFSCSGRRVYVCTRFFMYLQKGLSVCGFMVFILSTLIFSFSCCFYWK